MLGHHLIARDAVGDGVHDGPLLGGGFPAAVGFFAREFDDFGTAQIHVQRAFGHVDARPDNFAGLGNAAHGGAAFREIHGRLTETFRAFPAVNEMRGRRAAADLEHPDVFLRRARLVPIAPTHIVQRVFDGLLERFVDSLREQGIKAGALVRFVEMRHGFAFEQNALAIAGFHGRTIAVVQRALREIARGQQIFQALLILNADAVTAEVVGEAHGGHVGLALPEHLALGEITGFVATKIEHHALLLEPCETFARVVIADLRGLVVKRGLAEAFLEDARGVEQIVGNDRVEHAHATFVEHAHDGLVPLQRGGEGFAKFLRAHINFHLRQRCDVIGLVRTRTGLEPLTEFGFEIVVGEIFAPERRVFHALLGERAVQIQHADESRPRPRPVGAGEDRPAMRGESGEDVMRVLPDGFGDNERRIGINALEDIHAFALRINKTVSGVLVILVRADDVIAFRLERGGEGGFHLFLRGPADLIGREAQIAAGDELHLVLFQLGSLHVFCVLQNIYRRKN